MNTFLKTTAALALMAVSVSFAQENAAAAPAATPATTPASTSQGEKIAITEESGINAHEWHLKLGASYRSFRKARFNPAQPKTLSGAYWVGENNFGTLEDVLADHAGGLPGYVGIINASVTPSKQRGDYSFQESLGARVGGSYLLHSNDSLSLSLVANFQFFGISTGSKGALNTSDSVEYHAFVGYGMNPEPDENYAGEPGVEDSTAVSKSKFDMDLYVFDLGAELSYEFENRLSLGFAVGPTISIANMTSSSYSQIQSNAGISTAGGHSDRCQTLFGYYLSGNAAYWFNENYGLSFEIRYDKVFNDAHTSYAKQELDSWGGSLSFLWRF